MNPDFFLPHVLQLINGRRTIPWAIQDQTGTTSPALRAFVTSRLAWIAATTGVAFPEDPAAPYLTIHRTYEIPADRPTDGLALADETGLHVWTAFNPSTADSRAQFVVTHEIGHVLGLDHPQGDTFNPVFTNDVTIMSGGGRRPFSPWRGFFSDLDIAHLQQAHGTGTDQIIGTAEADRLRGTPGSDVLYGLGGPDRLRGGSGADWLHGGGGQDTFILDRPDGLPFSYDLIEDFGRRDVLLLRGMNPDKVRFSRSGDDTLVSYRSEPLAYLPATPFLNRADHLHP